MSCHIVIANAWDLVYSRYRIVTVRHTRFDIYCFDVYSLQVCFVPGLQWDFLIDPLGCWLRRAGRLLCCGGGGHTSGLIRSTQTAPTSLINPDEILTSARSTITLSTLARNLSPLHLQPPVTHMCSSHPRAPPAPARPSLQSVE
ncbi:hypothetical protein AAFF_G00416930 [Aldrovandia affinis]|uniref:Uncharacterized protein n=1 Tax=Aldrovandia affinis TaxID=143900 RepID=A0AAD7WJ79_9TELE|nr:hypothetical protein AAFF_G00416930 [Aldrovandia affinis]